MEPITIAWMMGALLSGWIGNRGDYWLCKGVNTLYSRIQNLNEPANHNIQRSIRKSYLKATLMAVDFTQKQRRRFSLNDRSWQNIEELKQYLKDQIRHTGNEDGSIRSSVMDTAHREILFPKEGQEASRMPELIQNLKDSIIKELELGGRFIDSAIKKCIYNGWQEGGKKIDFYELICAFFTQELKDNTQLSTYIQAEYLDHISTEIEHLSIEMNQLSAMLDPIVNEYKEILPKLDGIFFGIEDLLKGQQKIMDELPEKTAILVSERITDGTIAARQICVLDEYQICVKEKQKIFLIIEKLYKQIVGIKMAIAQVDESTKELLQENLKNHERELLVQTTKLKIKENELDTLARNVIQLAQQLKQPEALNTERLQKARDLFEKGNYKELNKLLNKADIDHDIERFEENGRILASELIIKAQTTELIKENGWFEEADRLYAKALQIIENYNTTFSYARFLSKHRQINKAAFLYETSLKHVSSDTQKAMILNDLSILQMKLNKYGEAEEFSIEALAIYLLLVIGNAKTYFPHLATTLNNLGVIHNERKEFDKAEAVYKEALSIYRQLAEVIPQSYLPEVILVLNNLGIIQNSKQKFKEAESFFEEALTISRNYTKVNSSVYLPYVATSLNNLGAYQTERNEFDKAEVSLNEALAIRRKLSEVNPNIYLIDVADTLINLSGFQSAINEFEKAEASCIEALAIYRELNEVNAQSYLKRLYNGLTSLARIQTERNELDKAEVSLNEALAIGRKLSEVNPNIYLIDVADTLNNIAYILIDKYEFKKAESSYEEVLTIYKKLAQDNPKGYSISYADASYRMAFFYRYIYVDKVKSIQYAKEAITRYAPFRNKVSHAEAYSKRAEEILKY